MRTSSYIGIFLCLGLLYCKPNMKSEVDLEFGALQGLLNGNQTIHYLGEIDMDKTPDCGRATAETQQQTTNPTPTRSERAVQSGTVNDRFSIISTFIMKNSNESLNMRFSYDRRQFKGPINPQQGFVLAGGMFGNTVTGRQGTVEWGAMGVNLIPSQSSQQLTYLDIRVELSGTFVPGQGTTIPPNQCYTQDGINCTVVQTSTQCFTVDNRTCLVDTGASGGSQPIIIRGRIRCTAPGII